LRLRRSVFSLPSSLCSTKLTLTHSIAFAPSPQIPSIKQCQPYFIVVVVVSCRRFRQIIGVKPVVVECRRRDTMKLLLTSVVSRAVRAKDTDAIFFLFSAFLVSSLAFSRSIPLLRPRAEKDREGPCVAIRIDRTREKSAMRERTRETESTRETTRGGD
jgi:hypothetical protein